MKISLNWLRKYCDWNCSVEELAEKLTMSGTEVEAIAKTGIESDEIVTAKILSIARHPNADRLTVCQVDTGTEKVQIVCGATNHREGDIVPLALPGAVLGEGFKIKKGKLRGEVSEGMMCSAKELGLAEDAEGLLILPQDTPIGKKMKELVKGDTVFEVEVTPNRADLLSYEGIAKELKALGMGCKPFPKAEEAKVEKASGEWKIKVEEEELCPRYTAQLIRRVNVGPSPEWLCEHLRAIGLRPINNVVDITNYVLFETGQPLHAFDADKLAGSMICVRKAQKGETFAALDEKTYKLEGNELVISDEKRAVALAGVMGGEETGVTESTKNLLIESAVFNALSVRKTSRKLQLISDSSYRFERGINPALTDRARNRATDLILEICGGQKEKVAWESSSFKPEEREVSLRPERCEKLLGTKISENRIKEILQNLGCEEKGNGTWKIPGWRPDIEREVDLIEEVARIEGTKDIKGKVFFGVAPYSQADLNYDRDMKIKNYLSDLGFYEMVSLELLPRSNNENAVLVENPMTEENVELRQSLLSSTLPCVAHNLAREQADLKLFEIGRVFFKDREEVRLLILGAGKERLPDWTEQGRAFDSFSLKGILDQLNKRFPEIEMSENIGRVDAGILKKHGIKVPVYAAECLLKDSRGVVIRKVKELSQYPAVVRDLAFIIDKGVKQENIMTAIESLKIAELESIRCFDLFEDKSGEKLGKEKKSLAYTLTYRSSERTLNDNEVSEWQKRVVNKVCEVTGAKLRDE